MPLDHFPATLQAWKAYSAVPSSLCEGPVFRSSDHVLVQIDKLVAAYREPQYISLKLDILAHLYWATQFWVKKLNKPEAFKGRNERVESISELRDLCRDKLEKRLHNASGSSFEEKLIDQFGLSVKEGIKQNDLRAAERGMPYLTQESDRRRFKLSFRHGIAYRWTYTMDDEKSQLEIYDTKKFNDTGSRQFENDVGLFVMGTNGRIYTGVDKSQYRGHVHSYFFAGEPVFTAGMMRVEDGRVATLSGSSGHYGPQAFHMLTVLNRLAAYDVNIGRIIMRRVNDKVGDKKVGDKEECKATDFLNRRGWPTGELPASMWVSK